MNYEIEQCVALDFETYSNVDLRSAGLDNYVNGEHFRVLLACVKFYHPTDMNTELTFDFVKDPELSLDTLKQVIADRYIVAHNAQFEQFVLRAIGIDLPACRFIDTAVLARAAGYGGSLEASAAQLLGEDKVETGAELIKLFCIPSAAQIEDNELWFDESLPTTLPLEWDMFKYYCKVDAHLCWEIACELLPQGYVQREITLSHLTMSMNMEGWFVDLELVRKMDEMYHANTELERSEFAARRNAEDLNLSSLPQLIAWCKARGVTAKSFDEKSVSSMLKRINRRLESLKPDDPKMQPLLEVKDLLLTKQQLGGSSLKKLDVILKTTSSDGRLRNQYMHVGAGATFRTTGRGVQMQNLKRLHGEGDDVREILLGVTEWDNDTLAANMRQVFRAEDPQYGQLIVGDFSSVESRGLAWQAGEQWKLDAYAKGQDLYKVQASQMFGVPVDQITKDQRQIGKVGELACGYGAGADAVRSFAEKMGVDLSEAESAKLVKDWRAANPMIVDYWQRLDDALHEAMHSGAKSVRIPHGTVVFTSMMAPHSLREQTGNQSLLSMQITMVPSGEGTIFTRWIHGVYEHGRNVQYWKPSERKTGDLWTDRFTDPKTKQQRKYSVYGGKLAGLLTQSLCREVFFDSLLSLQPVVDRIDNLKLIGQFHDEIVMEWSPGRYSLNKAVDLLQDRMTTTTLDKFPLGAEIKHAHRYIK